MNKPLTYRVYRHGVYEPVKEMTTAKKNVIAWIRDNIPDGETVTLYWRNPVWGLKIEQYRNI